MGKSGKDERLFEEKRTDLKYKNDVDGESKKP